MLRDARRALRRRPTEKPKYPARPQACATRPVSIAVARRANFRKFFDYDGVAPLPPLKISFPHLNPRIVSSHDPAVTFPRLSPLAGQSPSPNEGCAPRCAGALALPTAPAAAGRARHWSLDRRGGPIGACACMRQTPRGRTRRDSLVPRVAGSPTFCPRRARAWTGALGRCDAMLTSLQTLRGSASVRPPTPPTLHAKLNNALWVEGPCPKAANGPCATR